jgi:predicted small integral membrane protein
MKSVKIALVAAMALLLTFTAVNNMLMPKAAFGAISMALGMQSTFMNPLAMWRAITDPLLLWTVYGIIVLAEAVAAVLCWLGALRLWNARGSSQSFNLAKSTALLGLGITANFYLLGWLVFANEWFGMWQSQKMNVLPDAFRLFAEAMLIMLWVNTPDE